MEELILGTGDWLRGGGVLLWEVMVHNCNASGYCRPRMCYTGIFSWPTLLFFSAFCRGSVVLSKVFVFRYYRVVRPYYWRGGSGGNLPSSRT